jgi:hypothetical protein
MQPEVIGGVGSDSGVDQGCKLPEFKPRGMSVVDCGDVAWRHAPWLIPVVAKVGAVVVQPHRHCLRLQASWRLNSSFYLCYQVDAVGANNLASADNMSTIELGGWHTGVSEI